MTDSNKTTLATECITGPVGSGKTTHLIQRVTVLLEMGAKQEDICIFCATPSAVTAFTQRLHQALGSKAEGLTVTTHRSFACKMLATPEARVFTGREPRILAEFEHNFLLEDMKTSGLKPRRLKEMLKFFYRETTEMQDGKQGWLVHAEEEETYALLQSYLSLYGGMLEQEVSNFAVRYLQSSPEIQQAYAIKHVLVDDYQNISKASQLLSQCLAEASLCIAGNSNESLEMFESYPYAQGLEEFCETYSDASITLLTESFIPQGIQSVGASLLELATVDQAPETLEAFSQQPQTTTLETPTSLSPRSATPSSSDQTSSDVDILEYPTIPDEFEGVASFIAEKITQEGYEPHEIFVVAPNKNWSDHLVRFLDAKGLNTEAFPYGQALKGDIRDNAKCSALRLYTMLRLIAHAAGQEANVSQTGQSDSLVTADKTVESSDTSFVTPASTDASALTTIPPNTLAAVSWRCWCGFGDYLTHSNLFVGLKEYARKEGTDLVAALEAIANEEGLLAQELAPIISAYEQGKELIAQHKDLQGRELLERLAAALQAEAGLTTMLHLVGPLEDTDTAATMVARIEESLLAPHYSGAADVIKIGPPQSACGLNPKLLVYTGFVNGFIPSRDYFDGTKTTLEKQQALFKKYTRLLYTTLGKATDSVAVSYFNKADLESAELLKLKIGRIRLEEGVRVCSIAPSIFLTLFDHSHRAAMMTL